MSRCKKMIYTVVKNIMNVNRDPQSSSPSSIAEVEAPSAVGAGASVEEGASVGLSSSCSSSSMSRPRANM